MEREQKLREENFSLKRQLAAAMTKQAAVEESEKSLSERYTKLERERAKEASSMERLEASVKRLREQCSGLRGELKVASAVHARTKELKSASTATEEPQE